MWWYVTKCISSSPVLYFSPQYFYSVTYFFYNCVLIIWLFPQPHQEQRGWTIPGRRSPIQLLQPQLPKAMHPVSVDQQLGSLQLWLPNGGAQHLSTRLQGGPAQLLHGPDEHHWGWSTVGLPLTGMWKENYSQFIVLVVIRRALIE